MNKLVTLVLLAFFCAKVSSRTAHEWRDRTIYQIITDRFAPTDPNKATCNDLGNYCGGTFKGIEHNLNYIQGMGFNAIWISPVQTNSPGGYHGYWYTDFYGINENFGSEQDFIDLVKACHDRDMWIMVDIVANHIGYVQKNLEEYDYTVSTPFNNKDYFNPHVMDCTDAERLHPGSQVALETCWLFGLPDLDQNNPFVRKALCEWIEWFVKTYKVDGLRLDALRHVPLNFWADFNRHAGIFTIGEAFDFSIPYNAAYQGAIDSMLNFPLYSKLLESFMNNQSIAGIAQYYDEAFKVWPDITVLGNFANNLDKPRFLYNSNDIAGFKAAIGFTMVSVGIPILYYGDEQAFRGGFDPLNREPLWDSMNTDSEIYQFLKIINMHKYKTRYFEQEQIQRVFDDSFYSFSRGEHFFSFTNSHEIQIRTINDHSYKEGTILCNIFESKECVEVKNGGFVITIKNKEVKIFSPAEQEENKSLSSSILESIKVGISNAVCQEISAYSSNLL